MTHPNDDNSLDGSQICILWHAAERSPAASLITALTKRGMRVTTASSMHSVFATACRCIKSAKRVVIVLDDRDELIGVDRVLDGLERYGPDVICWEHCPDANPPMVPVVRLEAMPKQTPVSQPVPQPAPQSISKPSSTLRLVGEEDQSAKQPISQSISKPMSKPTINIPKNRPISSSDVLDADELDALLAGELGQGKRK